MIENIMQTCLLGVVIFAGIIKFHAEDEPPYWINAVEVFGVLGFLAGFIVSVLFLIWQV